MSSGRMSRSLAPFQPPPRRLGERSAQRRLQVRRAEGATANDGLDAFLLACADEETALHVLLDRLPCSRTAGFARVLRLADAGALVLRELPPAAPVPATDPPPGSECETVRPLCSLHAPAPPTVRPSGD